MPRASAWAYMHAPAIWPRGMASADCWPATCWNRCACWATGLRMTERQYELADEDATRALGQRVATALAGGLVVYLRGELGAGKTSFARALLTALGVGERIKSPTYSLVEGYQAGARPAWHLDLYRIADPGELEWLG